MATREFDSGRKDSLGRTIKEGGSTSPTAHPDASVLKNPEADFKTSDYTQELVEQAGAEDTSAERLRDLAEADSKQVRLEVAGNPHTPEDTLQRLAESNDAEIHEAILDNPLVGDTTRAYITNEEPFTT